MMDGYRYAYVHGFGSSSLSNKGVALAAHFAELGLKLHLPDLNSPSFEALTADGALAVLDRMDAETDGGPWRFIGSSMGGYLTALWTEINPDKVDKVVLLCPGFDIAERWPIIVGLDRMERWRESGYLSVPGPSGELAELEWGFVESWDKYPPYPDIACETLVFHGHQDVTVPITSSRAWVKTQVHARLVEFDDGHTLMNSFEQLIEGVEKFFSLLSK